MEIDRLFGLPAHPFFVHGAVVLVPLTALFALALVAKPDWRRRFGWHLIVSAVVALLATLMAYGSGEKFLEKVVDETDKAQARHQDLAEVARPFTFLFTVSVIAWIVLARRFERADGGITARNKQIALALSGLVGLLSILATIWIIRTGHEGSKAVWQGVK